MRRYHCILTRISEIFKIDMTKHCQAYKTTEILIFITILFIIAEENVHQLVNKQIVYIQTVE